MATSYVANAYDATKPDVDAIAGEMFQELNALKARLNKDLSAATLPTPLATTVETHRADFESRVAALEEWVVAFQETWANYTVADAAWKAEIEEQLNIIGGKADTNTNAINTANTAINLLNQRPTFSSGSVLPEATELREGDAFLQYAP